MKLTQLLERLEYEVVQGDDQIEVTELINDSRKVTEGSVFVCISGAVSDGHAYVQQVAEKGAAAVIVEKDVEAPEGLTVIKVENTRYALALTSAAYFGYPAEKLKVIGITGTKGKTTTTYMVKSILEEVGIKVGLIGTIEAIIGDKSIPANNTTPESYTIQKYFSEMVEEGCECVVMEVSSQGLKLDRTAGIPFEIGIFTNLGEDHIGPNEHKDFNEYKYCKSLLFKQCKIGIGNVDDKWFEDIFKDATCKVETFGFSEKADIRATDVKHISRPGYLGVQYHVAGLMDFDVEIDIPGDFSVYNSLTAIAVCRHFGVPVEDIKKALKVARVKGRIEMIKVSDDFTLMIDYAHNAMALESLLDTLRDYHPERIVTVFGCGGNRSKTRRYEMGEVSGKLSDFTIITSDNPRFEEPQAIIDDIVVGMKKTDGKYITNCDRITHEKLDKVFQYRIPSHLEGMLKVGMEVVVPFGMGNKEIKGYVTGFSERAEYAPEKMKEVLKIAEESVAIESKLVALAAWMKESYGGTMIQALKTVLPIKKKEKAKEKQKVRLLLPEAEGKEKLELYLHKNQKARARLLAALLDQPEQDYDFLIHKLNLTRSVVRALEEQKVLALESEQVYRNPVIYQQKEQKEIIYTEEQQAAIRTFSKDYEQGIRKTYLLYGVTGSGKTEVYMEMIDKVLSEGRQAIVLIPEIALTYQTVMRFYTRFGGRVSILNSRMSQGERYDQMERVKKGEVDIMIGPRSALFTPFERLGLIVIDEEHEPTYKSEQVPRFHARETAIERARMEGASVVLGSATPSLEAFYACECGRYQMLRLRNRTGKQALPEVYVADMREELKHGNRSILSDQLKVLMQDRLEKKEQIMLFLNRRGYAGFVSCRACGYVVKCPHCDVSLSVHRGGKMVCHYCGYETQTVKNCPVCGSPYIGGFRAGTQQIEDLVKREFPQARVLRMDMDTTKNKGGHEKILAKFADEEADIMIGTQMIVKGHDFPNVTLVGVLAADMSLYSDDYRSGERTFQLLTQAAGRAGRGRRPGEVIIQTYSPDHYSIRMAARQDYEGFYEKEMNYRDLMGYPPASQLMAVLMTGSDENKLTTAAEYLKKYAIRVSADGEVQVIGPASPSVGKVNDVYRKVIYLKSEEYQVLVRIKNHMERYIEINRGFANMRIQFDFNPMNIF